VIKFSLVATHVEMARQSVAALVSLTAPLASVAATGCECIPRVSMSSKGYEHKRKGDIYMYHFRDEIKSQNRVFGCHEASNTQIWILFPLWLCLDTANP
jgi:hypothetical protein